MFMSRLLLLAASLPVAASFAAGAAHLARPKAALHSTMLLGPEVADLAPMALLAKTGADAAIDDFFAFLWPATTALSAGLILKIIIDDQVEEGGPPLFIFGGVAGFFLFVMWSLFYPAFQ